MMRSVTVVSVHQTDKTTHAELAALGFDALLKSTVSMICTTPFHRIPSEVVTFAVAFPLVTKRPEELLDALMPSPPALVTFVLLEISSSKFGEYTVVPFKTCSAPNRSACPISWIGY